MCHAWRPGGYTEQNETSELYSLAHSTSPIRKLTNLPWDKGKPRSGLYSLVRKRNDEQQQVFSYFFFFLLVSVLFLFFCNLFSSGRQQRVLFGFYANELVGWRQSRRSFFFFFFFFVFVSMKNQVMERCSCINRVDWAAFVNLA